MAASSPTDRQIQFPNEYFHTVVLETLWHPDGVYNGDSVREDVRVVMRGTGFFYRIEGAPFLVTARHMFTTRAWRTNSWMPHPVHAVTPTAMRIHLRVATPSGEFDAEKLQYVDFVVPLVDTEGNPAWFEHPRGISVDLAARQLLDLPIDGMHFLPLEPKDAAYGDEPRFWVTQDVFIVGHPFGLNHGYLWPIWIRGSVASEPSLFFNYKEDEYPLFLVDSRTRPGNSGSPVFLMRRHFTDLNTDGDALPRSRLLGVYTGRINEESDLGIVWHIGEVDRMCRAMQNPAKESLSQR